MTKYHRKATYSRRFRRPSLLNTLLFRLSLLNPLTPKEFPMCNSRRNIIIRTVATIAGDIAIGVAIASVAIWIIQAATLGMFLSFLLWLVAAIASLALSQYVLHPALKLLLADNKLDRACTAVTDIAHAVQRTAQGAGNNPPWGDVLAAALQRKRA